MSLEGSGDFDVAVEIRRNRERLGLSHARIAELVGRSPSTVRSWERAKSTPTDPEVLRSLAAVLDLDESRLFAAANLHPPTDPRTERAHQALRSLAADVRQRSRAPGSPTAAPDDGEASDDDTQEELPRRGAHVRQQTDTSNVGDSMSPFMERLKSAVTRKATPAVPAGQAGALSTLPQRPPTPSYIESENERMAYRFRSVLTAAGIALALVVLAWAATNLFQALGETWDVLTSKL